MKKIIFFVFCFFQINSLFGWVITEVENRTNKHAILYRISGGSVNFCQEFSAESVISGLAINSPGKISIDSTIMETTNRNIKYFFNGPVSNFIQNLKKPDAFIDDYIFLTVGDLKGFLIWVGNLVGSDHVAQGTWFTRLHRKCLGNFFGSHLVYELVNVYQAKLIISAKNNTTGKIRFDLDFLPN